MQTLSRIALFILVFVLAACRQSAQQAATTPNAITATPEIEIEMAVEPSTLAVGEAVLLVTVHTPDGQPIETANVAVRGDMTHAGMAPVFGQTDDSVDGTYRVPFEWTMGGDWIVTVSVTLEDGQVVERTFEMTIPA